MANVRTARRSGLVLRDGRNRRNTLWVPSPAGTVTLVAASTAALLTVSNAALLALRPFTVVRVRGGMFIRTDTPSASEFQQASLGYAVVSDQAAAIGVTAIPTPETDRNSDLWFVYETIEQFHEFQDATGVQAQGGISRQFDSKAMRKVEEGSTIVTVAETSGISLGLVFVDYSRILIKLH